MKLYFLTSENLRSAAFIKDFAFYFKPLGKAILLHDTFGSPADTRFVSKRLSAYLSEEMQVNAVLNGDQRQLVALDGHTRADLIHAAMHQVNLVVMNTLCLEGTVDPFAVARSLQSQFDITETVLFPANSRSPLGAKPLRLAESAEIEPLASIYDEELPTLNAAKNLVPCWLAAPAAFAELP